MKVFISWSGTQSKKLAEAIRDWLPGVIQLVKPYFTPSDLEKGTRWASEIGKELEESQVGILCITRDNLHSDWVMFEAGALSKSLDKSHVCPILFGITNTDLAGPLKQFQTTEFNRSDFHKMISVINNRLGDSKLPAKTLENVLDKWWPELEERIQSILGESEEHTEPVRSDRDLLEEILTLSRNSSRRLARPISEKAISDLLERFCELHEQQASEDGDYQAALDFLQKLGEPINYIASRYKGITKDLDNLISKFRELEYLVRGKPSNSESNNDEDLF